MSLQVASLSNLLKNAILALTTTSPSEEEKPFSFLMNTTQQAELDNFVTALASSIITEIINNAETRTAMSIHTHSGVTTGGGISGPPVGGAVEIGSIV